MYAVDATDGTQRWQFKTGRVTSSPAVVDGTVYVGCCDNHLYAVDATDGTQCWQFETDDEVRSSPAVVDGTVYVGSCDGYVYGLSEASEEDHN